MKAILFGSIGSVVETSELQRAAFNHAFREQGLKWNWGVETYRSMLSTSGGVTRVRNYAASRGETVDAEAVHAAKNRQFHHMLATLELSARPGVADVCERATASGMRVGLVSTTNRASLDLVLNNAFGINRSTFDIVTSSELNLAQKPAPDIYQFALSMLRLSALDCVAIEDNGPGVRAARNAGIRCVAFTGANTASHDFRGAEAVMLDGLATHLFGKVAA
ncbi:MAG: HAD-IA family hydrolase [Devosiaceae bacterium]|nr:HAD-IA family hydrolase [Devosiaceae bacterium MH13]